MSPACHCSSIYSHEVQLLMKLQTCPQTLYMSTTNTIRVILYHFIHISCWSNLPDSLPSSLLRKSSRITWSFLLRLRLAQCIYRLEPSWLHPFYLLRSNDEDECFTWSLFSWQSWYLADTFVDEGPPQQYSTQICSLSKPEKYTLLDPMVIPTTKGKLYEWLGGKTD